MWGAGDFRFSSGFLMRARVVGVVSEVSDSVRALRPEPVGTGVVRALMHARAGEPHLVARGRGRAPAGPVGPVERVGRIWRSGSIGLSLGARRDAAPPRSKSRPALAANPLKGCGIGIGTSFRKTLLTSI